ncbi:MAG: cytochrome c family protein [Spirochaetes bacterium]|nr:cytochrome c family protein [Spirochaetota bacterium]
MKNPRKIFILTLSILLLSVITESKSKYEYVGSRQCRECHAEDSIGNQYKIWLSSPHARAYRVLSSEKARNIATRLAAENPQENPKCLKCHNTGANKYDQVKGEGVGCESCHGRGSGYYRASEHVDYTDRKLGYSKALKNGMTNIKGIENLKRRERMCMRCHREDRPCLPEDQKEVMKQKMTIQVVDKLIRGDANFSHPLRRY